MTGGAGRSPGGDGWRRCPALAGLLVLLLLAGVAGCGSSDESGGELTVGAASSLTGALTGYADTASSPSVRTTFAGSDLIAAQISRGVAIDVFAAASTEQPQALFEAGLVERPVEFAGNRVVIGVPRDSGIDSLEDLAKPGVSLVIGDDSVPIGIYAREVLARLPAATERDILANVRSQDPDAATITSKVIQGSADAGLVYETDVAGVSDEIRAVPIPAALQPRIAYSAAVVSGTDQPEASREYVIGLLDGAGAATLRRAGFPPPPP